VRGINKAKIFRDYLGITVGSFLVSFGLQALLIPDKIVQGGVSGLATIIHYVFHLPTGLTMLAFNIPLFIWGIKALGASFGAKSFYGSVATSIFVDFLARSHLIPKLTDNLLLASIYGGIIVGIGLGIVFRYKATTGGSDLGARLLNHYLGISVGQGILIIDFCIIAISALVFGVEEAMIGLLSLFITSKVVDLLQEGVSYVRTALIISQHPERIAQVVMSELERGVTSFSGRGLYTHTDKEILFCVLAREEITRLKDIVREVDKQAFVIITDAYEVLGEGFKPFN